MKDTMPDLDFPIAGPDPLMPLFKADAAGLGDAFTEEALKRRGVVPKPAKASPLTAKPQRGGVDI